MPFTSTAPGAGSGAGAATLPVSVICTVRCDDAGLREMIESLGRQRRPPREIVIVDGSPELGARTRAERRGEEMTSSLATLLPSTISLRVHSAPGVNIAQGRNLAVRHAQEEIVACIDSGCRARPDWLERLTAPLTDPAIDVVGGACCLPDASDAGSRPDPSDARRSTRFQRLVGLQTLPGQLARIDPSRFNPSARSLAFRKPAWRRAGGFPEWLYTAEDTLFDLKLRSLQPRVGYAFAPEAVVEWSPRPTFRGAFRQFYNYARGEARIGRCRASYRYNVLRYATLAVWLAAGTVAAWRAAWDASLSGGYVGLAWAATAVAAALLIRPHWKPAIRAAQALPGGSRIGGFIGALAIREWIALAQTAGYRAGLADVRRDPSTYVELLKRYWGSDQLPDLDHVPGWNAGQAAPPPRTLIVSWHWPPVRRACANVLDRLFRFASPEHFRVLTRSLPPIEAADDPPPALPTLRIGWPLADDRPVRFRTLWANVRTVFLALRAARRMQRGEEAPGLASRAFDCVLGVFPTRYSLLAGWLIARLSRVPFIAYMHDLFRETLLTGSRVKAWGWSRLDERILRDAALILVPTREHAEHYAARGLRHTFVLPHTIPDPDATAGSIAPRQDHGRHELIYSGAVYEPHLDAVQALIAAVAADARVHLRFLSRPTPVLAGQDVAWLAEKPMRAAIAEADVCVVALGWQTPYPEEVRVCFPSKMLDYLEAGKPILAVAPRGCFVDRFVRDTRCGVCVNEPAPEAFAAAWEILLDPARREDFGENAIRAAAQLDSRTWMGRLGERLTALAAGESMIVTAVAEITSVVDRTQAAVEQRTCEPATPRRASCDLVH